MVKAAAAGADNALLIDDPALERNRVDGFATAMILAAAIRRRGPFDLIMTGRQASDTNAGVVGIGIAHFLGIPCITLVGDAQVAEGEVTVDGKDSHAAGVKLALRLREDSIL
jgi:electron transfer flavoprotein beta subunit